jgi:transcriptional regulator with XRE-family HTH domain
MLSVRCGWSRLDDEAERQIPTMDTDPKAQLGYRLYWKRIALHLNLRDIAAQIGVRSVDLSGFEKGDFTKLTPDQLTAYLEVLAMSDKAADYLAAMETEAQIAESGQ